MATAAAIGNLNAMWGRKSKAVDIAAAEEVAPGGLKAAIREARIENAERTNIVVDLRDAAVARLELLNEALDPLFKEIPDDIEFFDRGISRGDVPRLWIDALAYVMMGRDKRTYRFVQDTRYGRKVIAESPEAADIATAATNYVARRLIERERALADDTIAGLVVGGSAKTWRRQRRRRAIRTFLLGAIAGVVALAASAWFFGANP